MSANDWYKPHAKNYQCNQHPRIPKSFSKEFSEVTGISRENSPHVIDRLRHLASCLKEPEEITLLRLQQGKNQKPRVLVNGTMIE